MYSVDVYLRVRRTVMVEGMSVREAARTFGLHRDTVRKMLEYSVPPGYRRQVPRVIAEDFLSDLKHRDDQDAVLCLWVFLGGPEGQITDPT